jgi:hypothetical protein
MTPINKQEIPEITNSLTFRTLLSSKVSVALLSYGNLSTLVFTVTSHTVVTMDPLLRKYGFKCYTRMVWLAWLRNLILHGPTSTGASICNHLRSLNVRYFRMVQVTRLKNTTSSSSSMACLPVELHENLPFGSKVISEGRTDRQTAWWPRRPSCPFVRKVG